MTSHITALPDDIRTFVHCFIIIIIIIDLFI